MAVDASTPVGSGPVTGAIRKAAQATGASFQYLLATAKVESDLNPNLTVRTSTATGLFQFIEQTWLATLKQAGPAFGYGNYANAISRSASGRYTVDDPGLRAEIMQLRKDPAANALMGGVFTQQNTAALSRRLGRVPSEGELYIAHFLGPSGAAKAISLAQSNPNATAAEIFPAEAARQSADLLRQAGQRAQHIRRLRRIGAPLPGRAQRIAHARGRPCAAAALRSDLGRKRTKGRAAEGRRRNGHQQARALAGVDPDRAGVRTGRQYACSRAGGIATRKRRCGRRHVSFAVPDRRAARGDRACDQRAVAPGAYESRAAARIVTKNRHRNRRVPRPARHPRDRVTRASARRSICSAIRARPRAGDPVAGFNARPRVNNLSIIPKIYGERFVKARALGLESSGGK